MFISVVFVSFDRELLPGCLWLIQSSGFYSLRETSQSFTHVIPSGLEIL